MTLTTQRRYKSANGLAYLKTGSGTPIVLVHGVGLRAEAWLNQAPLLSQQHRVYAIDMPGHGNSDLLDQEDAGLDEFVDAIAAWITAEISEPVIMIGHSMGSMIALNFAMRYPALCTGVAALNAVYRRTPEAVQAVQQRARDMVKNPAFDQVTTPVRRWFSQNPQGLEKQMAGLCAEWLLAAPTTGYARAYQIFSRNDGPPDAALTALEIPVIFITGACDTNSSGQMAERMAALCPYGRYAVIADSRHMLPMTHPEAVNPLLADFIQRCGAQTRSQT
ncbi:MAG: pimeloyl-ACP methyl ester carboxylesterase [Motiliproteus sp.]|jgi:pimeloyl-ACP methyl ester carboxylesterase